MGKDPDANRSVMIKKEEDKLKASIRKESNTRRVKDRAYTRGTNSGYLENDDEDDESISISKIKNQYKNAPAFSGENYSSADSDEPSDEDSEEVRDFYCAPPSLHGGARAMADRLPGLLIVVTLCHRQRSL